MEPRYLGWKWNFTRGWRGSFVPLDLDDFERPVSYAGIREPAGTSPLWAAANDADENGAERQE